MVEALPGQEAREARRKQALAEGTERLVAIAAQLRRQTNKRRAVRIIRAVLAEEAKRSLRLLALPQPPDYSL